MLPDKIDCRSEIRNNTDESVMKTRFTISREESGICSSHMIVDHEPGIRIHRDKPDHGPYYGTIRILKSEIIQMQSVHKDLYSVRSYTRSGVKPV